MSAAVSIAAPRCIAESELEVIAQLGVSVSARMTRVSCDEIAPAITEALQRVAEATDVGSCQLVEFGESAAIARIYAAQRPGDTEDARPQLPVCERWLEARLARGGVVAISRPNELPAEVCTTAICSLLAVPVSIAGQPVCVLVLADADIARGWAPPLVERLRLLSEILGAALQRHRQESALSANFAEITRLNARLQAENIYLKEEIKNYHDFDDIVGASEPLRLALDRVNQVAATNASVLLLGPTGTGKELFARALHERSRRHARPLVRVNCAALPPTLIESELFGHEKGAFTGAVATRQGRFELADGGTIFLDEIGDLPGDIQVKFLRVLQEGEFERVGSSRTRKVDVRVIAATHHDLAQAVAEGRFRADLYYRLSVYPIHLPPLRDRLDDIPRLVWFFIHRHQHDLGRQIARVPQSLLDELRKYDWPGNVRELENVVERAMIASSGDTLRLDAPLAPIARLEVQGAASDNLDVLQRRHLEKVLERCDWRINGVGNAAERLGIHPNTLRFRLKKLGVSRAATAPP